MSIPLQTHKLYAYVCASNFSPLKHTRQADPKRLIILVRKETTADDIHGMRSAAGILTENGGMTSHAAVVARGMGKCCVTGELSG